MTRDEALLVIAFNNGVRVNRHLDADELSTLSDNVEKVKRIQALEEAAPPPQPARSSKRNKERSEPTPREVVIRVADLSAQSIPKLMEPIAKQATVASELAYPLIHIIENSIRDLIERILEGEYGDDWWSKVDQSLRDKAAARLKNEEDEGWHTPRGTEPIQYIDLMDLPRIICDDKLWPLFDPILPNTDYVRSLAYEVNVSRRIVAHMNVLPQDEVKTVQAKFRSWAKLLKSKESKIP